MNYLAHVHLAYLTNTSITGNLMGDFTKGVQIDSLPLTWQQGINLHRKIDSYTDQHDIVREFKSEFGGLRRYAGIILDILFDHIIATHFSKVSELSLHNFAQCVYFDLASQQNKQPDRFRLFAQRMSKGEWLTAYLKLDGIQVALEKTALRLSSTPKFDDGLTWYINDKSRIDRLAMEFYQQLIIFSHEQSRILCIR